LACRPPAVIARSANDEAIQCFLAVLSSGLLRLRSQ
jgi:hypothetical protein